MTNLMRISEVASRIVRAYPICSWCLGRLFSSNITKAVKLGETLSEYTVDEGCSICYDLYKRRYELIRSAVVLISSYEFETFQVGAVIPKFMIDKEDEIRSRFKVNSGLAIKRAFTATFRMELEKILRKRPVLNKYDLLIQFDLASFLVKVESTTLTFLARYAKIKRGFPSRSPKCKTCHGATCNSCEHTGLDPSVQSVELQIVKAFLVAFDAEKVRISWSGTEDDDTLVLGKGRPIRVTVFGPKRRFTGLWRLDSGAGRPIQFVLVEERDLKEFKQSTLKKLVLINIKLKTTIDEGKVRQIESSLRTLDIEAMHGSPKKLYWSKVLQWSDDELNVAIQVDNGVNVWRIVLGNVESEHTFPSLSDILGEDMISGVHYDIIDFDT